MDGMTKPITSTIRREYMTWSTDRIAGHVLLQLRVGPKHEDLAVPPTGASAYSEGKGMGKGMVSS
ncbi:hypothetical protein C1H69_04640 [Billgrantia endophytica]|uniref:Uncharacterized protein n=1 Tax=Billgrantia endophytica TaxID=2033802 RepID=A0A2N7U981_9GAMM|nr:hypothetical protein C1H69_04640 [Halomonas endophytica]